MQAKHGSASSRERLASLSKCLGFRVETPQGKLGVVEGLRCDDDRAHELVVRAGKQGARLLILPVDDVAEIVADDRRVILRLPFHLTNSEGLSARARAAADPGA